MIITEEPPRLTRTKTTVSTDYQFSACYLTQLGTSFSYDYEYNGPSFRLVLTPLTERAFLSLTQAIKNFHCGTLVGPSGVGKSETIKELAKVLSCTTKLLKLVWDTLHYIYWYKRQKKSYYSLIQSLKNFISKSATFSAKCVNKICWMQDLHWLYNVISAEFLDISIFNLKGFVENIKNIID